MYVVAGVTGNTGSAVAELYVEMVTGIDSGHVAYEGPEASVVHGKLELHDILRGLAGRVAAG